MMTLCGGGAFDLLSSFVNTAHIMAIFASRHKAACLSPEEDEKQPWCNQAII